jgi:hypothetical protein
LKAFAKLKLGMTFHQKVLKKNLVPVLAYKMTIIALQPSITAGDYIDEPARHELPETTPAKAAFTELVSADAQEPPSKRVRTSPRKKTA